MNTSPVLHATFVIERAYPTTPQRIFAAFADPEQKRRWFVESEHAALEEYTLDFRVGGREQTRSRFSASAPEPVRDSELINEVWYQDIVLDRRIVTASTMALGDHRFSASQSTFEIAPTDSGAALRFTEQIAFFEGADGPELREAGWHQLFEQLAAKVAR
jgi:uncharacterized protein YndB with AHSA1/START domain